MTIDEGPVDGRNSRVADVCFAVFSTLAVALWLVVAFSVYLMAPDANTQEGLAAFAGGVTMLAAVPLALVCTGAAAVSRAAGRGGVGWVVVGVVAFLAVCATPWIARSLSALVE
ncbi:hypothetical protein [Dactylosporangium salmoneum]